MDGRADTLTKSNGSECVSEYLSLYLTLLLSFGPYIPDNNTRQGHTLLRTYVLRKK